VVVVYLASRREFWGSGCIPAVAGMGRVSMALLPDLWLRFELIEKINIYLWVGSMVTGRHNRSLRFKAVG
jgi:hypothetical protein